MMGGLSCPITSCPLYKKGSCKSSTEHVKIHRFPSTNSKVRERWEEFVTKQNGTPFKCGKTHGLCSAHFGARWMMPSGRITRDAIPTIAPVSTTKVLCKWDLESSKLIPVETDIMTERPCGDILQLDNSERSVGPDISSEDFREAESASSAVPIPFPESSEHFFSPENEDFLKSDGKALKPSKSLDTVADVENAIRYEKKVAMLRYQASMRKVRSLEVLLNTLKKNGNTSPDSSTSCSSPVDRDTPSTAQMSVPCGQNVPSTKNLHTSPPQLCRLPNLLSPLIGITSLGDSDLPPPLFDDYN